MKHKKIKGTIMRNKKATETLGYVMGAVLALVAVYALSNAVTGIDLSGLSKETVTWDVGNTYDFINDYGNPEICTHDCSGDHDIYFGNYNPDLVKIWANSWETVQIYCPGTLTEDPGVEKVIDCNGKEEIACMGIGDAEYLSCDPTMACVLEIEKDQYLCVKLKMDTAVGDPEEYKYVLINYLDTYPNSKFKWWFVE